MMTEQGSKFIWHWNGERIPPVSLPVCPPNPTADQVISIIQQPKVAPINQLEACAAAAMSNDVMLLVAHWFYKIRFNKRYKIPFSRSITKDFYDLSVMFVSLYNLCVQWHSLPECYKDLAENYPTGWHWFVRIAWELQEDIYYSLLDSNSSKSTALDYWQETRKSLLENKNPYGENKPDSSHKLHTWRLIEGVLRVKKSGYRPDLIKEFWSGRSQKSSKELRASFSERPYLQALGELCRNLKNAETVVLFIDKGALKRRIQGGNEINVCSIPQKREG